VGGARKGQPEIRNSAGNTPAALFGRAEREPGCKLFFFYSAWLYSQIAVSSGSKLSLKGSPAVTAQLKNTHLIIPRSRV
jgi:hypothetical protein